MNAGAGRAALLQQPDAVQVGGVAEPTVMREPVLPDPDALAKAVRGATGTDEARRQRLEALAQDIQAVGAHPGAPTREILLRLGDRWSALLLNILATGTYRHRELHRAINALSRLAPDTPISQRMLTLRLRVLERDGLVSRTVGTGIGPAVGYSLTGLGQGLVQQLQAVLRWSEQHAADIRAAQQAFDDRDTMPPHTRRHRAP